MSPQRLALECLLAAALGALALGLEFGLGLGTAQAGGATPAFGLPPLPHATAERPSERLSERPDARQVDLGRKLFFERRLSANGTMSCAMCHVPEQGFTSNASRTALGIEGKSLPRNAPSLLNVAWQTSLFHDGRASSLPAQAWLPLLNPDEMANTSVTQVLRRLRSLPGYRAEFQRAFGPAGVSENTVGLALAAFEASLVAADSRFDRWRYGGQTSALTEAEQAGFRLFTGKAACNVCHQVGERHALFADGGFHVTGAGFVPPDGAGYTVPLAPGVSIVVADADLAAFAASTAPDLGRYAVTGAAADRHAFKTPSLRNVAATAPYMHDGSLATLEEVIDFYNRGGGAAPGQSALLLPLGLTAEERRALLAFLHTLGATGLPALVVNSRLPAP